MISLHIFLFSILVTARVATFCNASYLGNFQLCFGEECLPEVAEGIIYPTTGSVTLAPNASNGNFDKGIRTVVHVESVNSPAAKE